MGKRTKRFTAFIWLIAAAGAAGISIFIKPARIKSEGRADRYVYAFGKKKKNNASAIAVTNVGPGKAVKAASTNFFKNIL